MIHERASLVSRLEPGHVLEGREEATAFILATVATRLYEATAETYSPLDDERVVVQGRMRWIDEERVIRDDPVVWALAFEDGLLVYSVPARNAVEAEALLTKG
jgi:hypothetical protein